jgi:HlyD family secretion protein
MQSPDPRLTDGSQDTTAQSDVISQPTPEDGRTRPKPSRTLVASAAVLILFLSSLAVLAIHRSSGARSGLVVSVQKAPATHTLRLKGTTEAIQSHAVLAPVLSGQQVGTLTITKLLAAGNKVKRGDLLVEFDRQAQVRDFLNKQTEYNKLLVQVAERQATENEDRAKDETALHQAESELRNAELEMKTVELQSRIEVEKNQLSLDQAIARVQQLKQTFELKRSAARAAIRIREIQRDRTQRTMQNAQANAELMQIHSPLDGVVVLNQIEKNGRQSEVQEGDQVRPGVALMQVINPSGMQVQVLVNQEDILAIQIGQTAKVRLDAYPELVFPGKLEQIAPTGRGGNFFSKMRTFSTVFSIQGNDARLTPDLSASVDIAADAKGGDVSAK